MYNNNYSSKHKFYQLSIYTIQLLFLFFHITFEEGEGKFETCSTEQDVLGVFLRHGM